MKLNGVYYQEQTCYYKDNLIGNENTKYDHIRKLKILVSVHTSVEHCCVL